MTIRVVIFDDESEIRLFLTRVLQRRGYEIHAYSQPLECPSYLVNDCACKRNQPCADILITDLHMPEMSGLDFLEHQFANGCHCEPRNKAIISGNLSDDDRERARKMGCQVFDKPLELPIFLNWLDACEARLDRARVKSAKNH
jgi:CheY-like chemotaxis protein